MPSKYPGACFAPVSWCLMLMDRYGPEFVRPVVEADLFRGIQMGETCCHTVLQSFPLPSKFLLHMWKVINFALA